VGFNDLLVDPGGVVRRGLLFLDDGVDVSYAFALRLVLDYLKPQGIMLAPDTMNPDHVRLGAVTMPPLERGEGAYLQLDARGYQYLLSFTGSGPPTAQISVSQVLDGSFDANAFQGRIVIVGITGESVKDIFFTPLNTGLGRHAPMPGAVLHAQATGQLLRMALGEEPLTKPSGRWMAVAWLWIWTLLGGFAGYWARSMIVAIASLAAGGVALVSIGIYAFAQSWWIPVVPPLAGYFGAAGLTLAYVSTREKRERALLMQLFSRHVSSDVAQELWRQRKLFLVGGRPRSQRLTATVLFTDLVGFTSVSEDLDPDSLMRWLNETMETLAQVVMRHHGVIDKFIGDSIMAVFGVPLKRISDEQIRRDAVAAVECALALEAALEGLNAGWREKNQPEVGMRIGIHTGPLVAGGLGSRERLDYTVVGDTVNTASRLESFDKEVETGESRCRILTGEATLRHLGHAYDFRYVGEVALKGKRDVIKAYRILGHKESP
jgi:adenylate cyclase